LVWHEIPLLAGKRSSLPDAGAPLAAFRELTSFIGCEQEINALRWLLTTTPLVTLLGPGGSGKPRLARRVAMQLADDFADGMYLFVLESLHEDVVAFTTRCRCVSLVTSALSPRIKPH
jgi:non-specific serine/threonine protein kinase